jgi:hypothetical protein
MKELDLVSEVATLKDRIVELESVVADYAFRFGLTDLARKAMIADPKRSDRKSPGI